jgi:hypothetical protein
MKRGSLAVVIGVFTALVLAGIVFYDIYLNDSSRVEFDPGQPIPAEGGAEKIDELVDSVKGKLIDGSNPSLHGQIDDMVENGLRPLAQSDSYAGHSTKLGLVVAEANEIDVFVGTVGAKYLKGIDGRTVVLGPDSSEWVGDFVHEMNGHAVQDAFGHPAFSGCTTAEMGPWDDADKWYQAATEWHANLAEAGGDVTQAKQITIAHNYGEAIDTLNGFSLDPLTDEQLYGASQDLTYKLRCGVQNPVTGQFVSQFDQALADSLAKVTDPNWELSTIDKMIPGGDSPYASKRMIALIKKVGVWPSLQWFKKIPSWFGPAGVILGGGAGVILTADAALAGDWEQAAYEALGTAPIIGEGQAAGEIIVEPTAEALSVVDTLALFILRMQGFELTSTIGIDIVQTPYGPIIMANDEAMAYVGECGGVDEFLNVAFPDELPNEDECEEDGIVISEPEQFPPTTDCEEVEGSNGFDFWRCRPFGGGTDPGSGNAAES